MKVAIISDVHGNHVALTEVLRVAKKENAEKLLVLGDVCGYYYHPEKVLQMMAQWDYELIRGNHEKILLEIKNGQLDEREVRVKYGSGHRMALENLSEQEIQKIVSAPDQLKVEIHKTRILMCHGSPVDPDQYLYPDSDQSLLEQCNVEDADFVFVGHSHYPFIYRNKSGMLINVGSVGQSRSVGGMASWVMLDTVTRVVEMKATPYLTEELEKEITRIDPEVRYLADILKRNRN